MLPNWFVQMRYILNKLHTEKMNAMNTYDAVPSLDR